MKITLLNNLESNFVSFQYKTLNISLVDNITNTVTINAINNTDNLSIIKSQVSILNDPLPVLGITKS
jgi:hypothetical protein